MWKYIIFPNADDEKDPEDLPKLFIDHEECIVHHLGEFMVSNHVSFTSNSNCSYPSIALCLDSLHLNVAALFLPFKIDSDT